MVKHGLAELYEVDGMPYLHFPKFRDNQSRLRKDRESPKVPTPQGFDDDGQLPELFRKPSGYAPDHLRPQVEGEVEEKGEVEGELDRESDDSLPESADSGGQKASGAASPPYQEIHDVFLDELGGDPPYPNLTPKRRKKYRKLWDEHLAQLDDWQSVWRSLLQSLKSSDHHMSERSYQMPESFLRNEERRDRWIQKAYEHLNGGGQMSDADRRLMRRRRELDEQDLEAAVV